MSERSIKEIFTKKGLVEKILIVVVIIFIVSTGLIVVGYKNFNTNKVVYLKFGYPSMLGEKNLNVTRISIIHGESIQNKDSVFTSMMITQFDVNISDSVEPRGAVAWNKIAFVFNERIVLSKSIENITLLIQGYNSSRELLYLTASINIPYDINTISINNFNATTYKIEATVDEINPILDMLSFL